MLQSLRRFAASLAASFAALVAGVHSQTLICTDGTNGRCITMAGASVTPSTRILGLGTAAPRHSIAQGHAAALAATRCCTSAEQARLLPVLYRRTRVDRRGSVLLEELPAVVEAAATDGHAGRVNGTPEVAPPTLTAAAESFFPPATASDDRGPTTAERLERYAQEALPLAVEASRRALADAGVDAQTITQLVTVSCTGFVAPGIDSTLMAPLGLRPTVGRTNVGFMGCHGALNGLRVAAALAAADPRARVLLCAVELCTLHFHYGWDPEKIVANALFADGAAAAVVGSGDAAGEGWLVLAHGACVFPDSTAEMTWRIGDHGFVMTLSARVPELIAAHLRPWVEAWLGDHGLRIGDVGSWAIHPGGPRIVSSAAAALGLPDAAAEASHAVLARHGNMSSPTLLFILDELRRRGAPRPCVALGFGPGLAVEGVVLG